MYYLQLIAGFVALCAIVALLILLASGNAHAACTYNTVILSNGSVLTTMTCCSSGGNCITTVIQ
jgi:hypothetical protein